MNKRQDVTLVSMIGTNLVVFAAFFLANLFMKTSLSPWYILLILGVMSGFEALFFYRKTGDARSSVGSRESLEISLMSVGSTVLLIGTILFVVAMII